MTEAADQYVSASGWRDLRHLPIALFGGVMGLTGLSVAWSLAHASFGAPTAIGRWIGVLACAAFVIVSLGYAVKIAIAWDAVRTEFRHPVAGPLFGTFLISLLLLPIVIAPVFLVLAQVIWATGTIAMLLFSWLIVSRWMNGGQEISQVSPTWMVPVVGLLDVPLAIPSLSLPPIHGVMVLGLSIGLFFAVPLFTIIFSRLLLGPPMSNALQPTLMILLAPFAVGFSAYVATTGHIDLLAESLYILLLFFLVLLVGRLRNLPHCCPFRISWWAVSFPLAASSIAALRFAQSEPNWFTNSVALVMLALATVIIFGLLIRTLTGIACGELKTLSSAGPIP